MTPGWPFVACCFALSVWGFREWRRLNQPRDRRLIVGLAELRADMAAFENGAEMPMEDAR